MPKMMIDGRDHWRFDGSLRSVAGASRRDQVLTLRSVPGFPPVSNPFARQFPGSDGLPTRIADELPTGMGERGMQDWRQSVGRVSIPLLLGTLAPGCAMHVRAQAPEAPPPAPPPAAANPKPAAPTPHEAELEERLRKLEAMNQRILQQYDAMEQKHKEQYEKLSQDFQALQDRVKAGASTPLSPVVPDLNRNRIPDDQETAGIQGTIGRSSPSDMDEAGAEEGPAAPAAARRADRQPGDARAPGDDQPDPRDGRGPGHQDHRRAWTQVHIRATTSSSSSFTT